MNPAALSDWASLLIGCPFARRFSTRDDDCNSVDGWYRLREREFACVTVFLVGFRLLAMMAFPTLVIGAWLIVRKHPKMFQLWGLSLSQKSYYDPRQH